MISFEKQMHGGLAYVQPVLPKIGVLKPRRKALRRQVADFIGRVFTTCSNARG